MDNVRRNFYFIIRPRSSYSCRVLLFFVEWAVTDRYRLVRSHKSEQVMSSEIGNDYIKFDTRMRPIP